MSTAAALPTLTDEQIVERVKAGDTAVFEVLMRRHNQRVYRTARAILKDEAEVEDVMQQAYINAFTHLRQFESRAQFSTWLTRITVYEALSRRRRTRPFEPIAMTDAEESRDTIHALPSPQPDPERQAYSSELQRMIEAAVDRLPDAYRSVFMLRDIEGLTTTETAEGLDLGEEAVKTRLHRARAMLRRAVTDRLGAAAAGAFQFQAPRCDRVVAAVLNRLAELAE